MKILYLALKSQRISFLKVYLPIQWRISYYSSKWALPAWTISSTTCWNGKRCSFWAFICWFYSIKSWFWDITVFICDCLSFSSFLIASSYIFVLLLCAVFFIKWAAFPFYSLKTFKITKFEYLYKISKGLTWCVSCWGKNSRNFRIYIDAWFLDFHAFLVSLLNSYFHPFSEWISNNTVDHINEIITWKQI